MLFSAYHSIRLVSNSSSSLSLLVVLLVEMQDTCFSDISVHQKFFRHVYTYLYIIFPGTLVWKISDYSSKMAEAKTKEGMELVSPPFFTSQYGYKLQASIFLNGNGAGEGSHVSVYIKILPGEYDALLRWPFAHSLSFTLFDQTSVPEKVRFCWFCL